MIEQIEVIERLRGLLYIAELSRVSTFYRLCAGDHPIDLAVEEELVEAVRCQTRCETFVATFSE